jgi:hypothetical protein
MSRAARRLSISLVVAAITVAGAASCLDFDELTGASPSSAEDASISNDDGASSDASNSADVLEDAPDAPFCVRNPGHTLCDDFDEPTFLSAWNSTPLLSLGSTVTQDPKLFTSMPYSLNATTKYIDSGNSVWLVSNYPEIPQRIAISFDFYVVTDGTDSVALTKINLPDGYVYVIRLRPPDPPYLDIQQVAPPATDGGAFRYLDVASLNFLVQVGQWYHVSIALPINGADAGNITASFNGAATISAAPPLQTSFADGGFTLQAGVGSYSGEPYDPWSIRLDNYVFDLE